MSNYYLSNGEKISKRKIDLKVSQAKKEKWLNYDYSGCEHCKKSNQMQYDTSHIISVKECQEMRQSELSWNLSNLEILCRSCHMTHENKTLQERKEIFNNKN